MEEDQLMTAEQIAEQKAFEERKARVNSAAEAMATAVAQYGLSVRDFEWACSEARDKLIVALP